MATKAKKAPARKGKAKKADKELERRLEVLDPRQAEAMKHLYDPESPTFGNFKGSFIAAGFSEVYADNITNLSPKWLSGFIGDDAPKLAKVERNLNKFLDLNTEQPVYAPNGAQVYLDPEKTRPKMEENPRLLDLQMKATFFVGERLNRKKYGRDDKVNVGFQFNIAPIRREYE